MQHPPCPQAELIQPDSLATETIEKAIPTPVILVQYIMQCTIIPNNKISKQPSLSPRCSGTLLGSSNTAY